MSRGTWPRTMLTIAVTAAATTCSCTPESDPGLSEQDHDSDGWTVEAGDCNDAHAAVYPGADELCDGHDNDCDGVVPPDEIDDDLDGFDECSGLDCDDADPLVSPYAIETCDGVDNDCDGQIDEQGATGEGTFYEDEDGDGVGAAGTGVQACEPPTDHVERDTDCDDSDPEVHPGAEEICGDGIDNNCDGAPSPGCGILGQVDLFEAGARLIGVYAYDDPVALHHNPDYAGHAVAAGDLDGDGHRDVVATSIWRGGASGYAYAEPGPLYGEVLLQDAATRIEGIEEGARLGTAAAADGDMNGDGHDDLLFGAYLEDRFLPSAGAVYLFHGPAAGQMTVDAADARITGSDSGQMVGHSLAYLGDLDGDGHDEFLVGAIGVGPSGDGIGRAFLIRGPVTGRTTVEVAAAHLVAETEADYFGRAVSSAGDVDGDGVTDLVVGAPFSDIAGPEAGMVYLFSGGVGGEVPASNAMARIGGEMSGDLAGIDVSGAGDVDGDGFDDLLIGAECFDGGGYYHGGAAYLVRGPVSGMISLSTAYARFEGTEAGMAAGRSVAGVGDVNGDGEPDILIGSNDSTASIGDCDGLAWLLYGPLPAGSTSLLDADATFYAEGCPHCGVGYDVAGAGDVDGDGYDDVLVGAPWAYQKRGAAFLLYGGPLL